MRTTWTLQKITEAASKCKNRRELQTKFIGAYKAAARLDILHELYPDYAQIQWTDEMLKAEASKYKSRGAFAANSSSAYVIARKRGLLDIICPPKISRTHTRESLTKLGKQYKTRTEFARKDPGAYSSAQRAGLLNEVCPPNIGGTSQGEAELLEFLRSLISDFIKKKFSNDYELDCYSDSLKLGIEYNGLYWHSDANPKMFPSYHVKKTKYFEQQGIRVIHIWEHEWTARKTQVKNYLQSACRVNTVRLGARKCEFKEIPAQQAREFIQNAHIQGKPNHVALAIGCFYKEQLIAAASFGRHHRDSTANYVLNRFCCLPGYTVSGCLAKMSKLAANKLGPLISWADYCKSQAGGYIAAGWIKVRTLKPDYFYTDKRGGVISKQARKKSHVDTPQSMTESEHAKLDGLHRIWDCGKIVLIFK